MAAFTNILMRVFSFNIFKLCIRTVVCSDADAQKNAVAIAHIYLVLSRLDLNGIPRSFHSNPNPDTALAFATAQYGAKLLGHWQRLHLREGGH